MQGQAANLAAVVSVFKLDGGNASGAATTANPAALPSAAVSKTAQGIRNTAPRLRSVS
jgi:hypothetical protein